jgi:hypothetical protein
VGANGARREYVEMRGGYDGKAGWRRRRNKKIETAYETMLERREAYLLRRLTFALCLMSRPAIS